MNATTNTAGLMATPLPTDTLPYLVAQAPARQHPEHPVETVARQHPVHLPDSCPVYSWCLQVGDHDDHQGEGHDVPSHEGEEPLLVAGLLHLSGSRPLVDIGGDGFTPDQARTKAQQLRALADVIDTMADTVQAAGVEAMTEQLNALREGASGDLAGFLNRATQTLHHVGNAQAFAGGFLTAVADGTQVGGAR